MKKVQIWVKDDNYMAELNLLSYNFFSQNREMIKYWFIKSYIRR